MTKKILGFILAVVVIVLGAVGWSSFHPNGSTAASSNINSINLTPSSQPGGDTYGLAFNGVPMIDLVGDLISTIGVTVTNNLIQGANGFTGNFSTSTTLTAAQFCGTTNERWLNTTAVATATLPAATTTWATCGSSAGFGSWNGNLVTNDSTNTVNFVAGTGMTFKCETSGVGTTTVQGGCTASQVSLNATSTVQVNGYWDAASSSLIVIWGNMFH